jgi:hypothetical protein
VLEGGVGEVVGHHLGNEPGLRAMGLVTAIVLSEGHFYHEPHETKKVPNTYYKKYYKKLRHSCSRLVHTLPSRNLHKLKCAYK